jgi:hypothetical protein
MFPLQDRHARECAHLYLFGLAIEILPSLILSRNNPSRELLENHRP